MTMSSNIAMSWRSDVQRTLAAWRRHGSVLQCHSRSVVTRAEQLYEYSPSVTLKDVDSQAQLTCTAPVEAGEVLVTVPESSWLDCNAVSSSSIGSTTAGMPNVISYAAFLAEAEFGARCGVQGALVGCSWLYSCFMQKIPTTPSGALT